MPAWLARRVTVPLAPMLIKVLVSVSIAALPLARVMVTGNPELADATTGIGLVN